MNRKGFLATMGLLLAKVGLRKPGPIQAVDDSVPHYSIWTGVWVSPTFEGNTPVTYRAIDGRA